MSIVELFHRASAKRADPAEKPVRQKLLASRAARVGGLRAPAETSVQGQSSPAYSSCSRCAAQIPGLTAP
jgi:hypothetical protein